MSTFIKTGNSFDVHPDDAIDQYKKLPPGTYSVMQSMERGLYLETAKNLSITHKVYGNTEVMSDRILDTYNDRESNTGALLSGDKGSGKTLLAKMTAIKAQKRGMIVIYVNSPIFGERFNRFISNIDQPALIMIDEFEKVYDLNQQQSLLTLFDGLYPSKKLFMVTVNETTKMSPYLLNRPGRFFYNLKYQGLTLAQITEYVRDNLKDQTKLDAVIKACAMIRGMSYDSLKAICEEINRYGEEPSQVLKILNIEVSPNRLAHEVVSITDKEGNPLIIQKRRTYPFAPMFEVGSITFFKNEVAKKDEDYEYIEVEPDDIVSVIDGQVTYKTPEHTVIIKEPKTRWDAKETLLKGLENPEVPTPVPFDQLFVKVANS